jgi:hypothetical protein
MVTTMQIKQQRVLQSLRRVQAWCAANPGYVPAPEGPPADWIPLTRQLDALNAIVARLGESAADQQILTEGRKLAATGEPALRKRLREELHRVTQVARALRRTVPGIGILKMPPSNIQSEPLLKVADAITKKASTYREVLVEHGLPGDFPAQLTTATSALRASIDGRGAARAGRTKATKQVAVDCGLGMQYVQFMDAALTMALRDDPARLAEWQSAKRIVLKAVPALVPATPAALSAVTGAGAAAADTKAA